MAQSISERELRNDSGELTPMQRHRFVLCEAAAAMFTCAPGIHFDRFQADLDALASQNIESCA